VDRTNRLETRGDPAKPIAAGTSNSTGDIRIERRWFLLARVDHEKFHFFYDKYHDPIHRFIMHRTGDRDLTDELTSETFLRALRGLWKFRWQGITFGAWLFRIAVNVVNRHYRSESRWRMRPLYEDEDSLHDPARDPLRVMVDNEWEKLLRLAISELDQETQTILVLRYFERLKIREISLVTQLPEGTIKARISRALKKLRKHLIDRKSPQGGLK